MINEEHIPHSNADVPNGEDIRDVCRAVVQEFGPRRLPKRLRERFMDADGELVSRIAERVLKQRYPSA